MIKSALFASATLIATLVPAVDATPSSYFPEYTGDEFQALYDYAVENTLDNLIPPGEPMPITGDVDLDTRIWELAFERGYVLRPEAGDGLAAVDGIRMQPEAAEAWQALKAEARENGHYFIVSSAYRSPVSQRSWFLGKLSGTSDEAIDDTLRWYSLPGTSKHHAGYALDFRYSEGTFGEFRSTPDYAWLSADNFYVPKKYGFIPSYPDNVEDQGPNPEPWEFVWVGVDLIRCGIPIDLSQSKVARSHRWLTEDIVACSGGITTEEFDALLKSRGAKIEAMLRA